MIMNIPASYLRNEVIKPTLKNLNLVSEAAENLLLGTAALSCHTLQQTKDVPTLGIYQITSQQHQDILDNFLPNYPILAADVRSYASMRLYMKNERDRELVTNLAYATAIARLIYYRSQKPLPAANDINGLAKYWKRYFSSINDSDYTENFINYYTAYVG